MEKVLYCRNRASKRKISLPFPFKIISRVEEIKKKNCPFIIFPEEFLRKRKKINLSLLKEKVCFVHFSKRSKDNLKVVKQFGFFDYITDEDTKAELSFKFQRASNFLGLKTRVSSLEKELSKKSKKIEEITLVDPLTGCYNWRYFLNRAQQELNRCRRHLYSVSFIGVDIDNFRQINEIYGVRVADRVTKELVGILRTISRREDVLARWRSDEFFMIIPHLDDKNAYTVAQRIKEKISVHRFKYKRITLTIKVSIGVVSSPEDNIFNARDIINALNKCFTSAERKGGDTIIFYSQAKFKPLLKQKSKASIRELREKIEGMNVLLNRDLMEMIYGFARTIEAKDSYTGKHVEYTSVLAEEIARNLNLPEEEIENIKHAAVLHDLGKVGIDENILSKKGPLTAKEREIIKTHPSIAAEILREIRSLRGALSAILYHHERYDGKGYPLGLKGEEIPLSARIVAVADVYQALISDRPYRKAYSKEKALEIIKQESGKQFDSKIVKVFLKIVDKVNEKKR